MPKELSTDHPNLISARARMVRICQAWAVLSLLFAVLTLGTVDASYPLAAAPWLIQALLLIINQQPVFLGLTAILWGISVLQLLPGAANYAGPDPLTIIFDASVIEVIAFGVVRFLLFLMAWNQFMFYRMLYGTAGSSGLGEDLAVIPEMVENWSDVLARIIQVFSIVGFLAAWGSIGLGPGLPQAVLLGFAYVSVVFSIGLGVAIIFSPTDRRRAALIAIFIGFLTFVSLNIIGRL